MKRHSLWMLLGCALPLLLLFVLPLLGVSGNVATFLFILVMFACHLLAMRGHTHKHDGDERTRGNPHGDH